METNTIKMNTTLNKTESFNPADYLENAKDVMGNEIIMPNGENLRYVSTDAKVFWFRLVYPHGRIEVEPVQAFAQTPSRVAVKASVYFSVDDDHPAATWIQQRTYGSGDFDSFVSSVETIAIGRALSKAGFGCELEAKLNASTLESQQGGKAVSSAPVIQGMQPQTQSAAMQNTAPMQQTPSFSEESNAVYTQPASESQPEAAPAQMQTEISPAQDVHENIQAPETFEPVSQDDQQEPGMDELRALFADDIEPETPDIPEPVPAMDIEEESHADNAAKVAPDEVIITADDVYPEEENMTAAPEEPSEEAKAETAEEEKSSKPKTRKPRAKKSSSRKATKAEEKQEEPAPSEEPVQPQAEAEEAVQPQQQELNVPAATEDASADPDLQNALDTVFRVEGKASANLEELSGRGLTFAEILHGVGNPVSFLKVLNRENIRKVCAPESIEAAEVIRAAMHDGKVSFA